MAQGTTIEWTESTWNPVTGCSRVSAGCKHCYAERMARRLAAMGQRNYRNSFAVTLQPHMIDLPRRWKRPRTIFVNSMSDLFHEEVPLSYIQRIFETMRASPRHTFQILTKRARRLAAFDPWIDWAPNIWMGVSVENASWLSRIDFLRQSRAHVRFLSFEPLLGPLPHLDLSGMDWVIVGGESGPKARKMEHSWAIDIRDRCIESRVPFFFKQWGGWNRKRTGRILDGRTWDELPLAALGHSNELNDLQARRLVG